MRGSPRSLVLAAVLLAGCQRKQLVWQGDTTIAGDGIVLTARPPLRAPGPTHEVCLVPKDDRMMASWDSLYVPGEPGIHPDIYLIRAGAVRDRLGYDAETVLALVPPSGVTVYPDTMIVNRESERRTLVYPAVPPSVKHEWDDGLICIRGHESYESPRTYDAIEIRTDRPLAIQEVRWWSGQLTAWP